MPDSYPVSPEPFSQTAPTSTPIYRFGLGLTLAGNLLAVAAFFAPWLDVFKLNDPSFPFPRRAYSPWTALQAGRLDALGVAIGLFSLLIVGMALSSLALILVQTVRKRAQAIGVACALAVAMLMLMAFVVPAITFNLSFEWPFLSSTVLYGVYLAVAGCVSVLIGLAALTSTSARR